MFFTISRSWGKQEHLLLPCLERERNLKERIASLALERFGYEDFHPGQKEAIESILEGRDTLAVMPTGSGKSAIYQIAGLLIPGSTVAISPLISLQ